MKIRRSFVANSSSSSFVILGYYQDIDNYKERDILEEKGLNVVPTSPYGDTYHVGVQIAGGDGGDCLEVDEFVDKINKAKEKLESMDIKNYSIMIGGYYNG